MATPSLGSNDESVNTSICAWRSGWPDANVRSPVAPNSITARMLLGVFSSGRNPTMAIDRTCEGGVSDMPRGSTSVTGLASCSSVTSSFCADSRVWTVA